MDKELEKQIDLITENLKKVPLSNFDIKALDPNIKITYSDNLEFMRFADELFFDYNNIGILLWKTMSGRGHWLGLIRNDKDKTIEVFDSYGYNFKNINKNLNSNMNLSPNLLLDLIRNSGYKAIFNKKIYQDRKDISNQSCGRWVLLRLSLKKYNLKDFNRILQIIKKKMDIKPLELSVLNSL